MTNPRQLDMYTKPDTAPQDAAPPDKEEKKPYAPVLPSAWGMTPAQRLKRLYTFFDFVKNVQGSTSIEARKRERYLIEIEAIENAPQNPR